MQRSGKHAPVPWFGNTLLSSTQEQKTSALLSFNSEYVVSVLFSVTVSSSISAFVYLSHSPRRARSVPHSLRKLQPFMHRFLFSVCLHSIASYLRRHPLSTLHLPHASSSCLSVTFVLCYSHLSRPICHSFHPVSECLCPPTFPPSSLAYAVTFSADTASLHFTLELFLTLPVPSKTIQTSAETEADSTCATPSSEYSLL